jgi:putative tryptophan/tyrosine transport system substrate-binding protein
MPAPDFANRVFCGWRLIFLLLLYAASPAHAQLLQASTQPEVTIVLSEAGGAYAEFGNALDTLLTGRGVSHRVIAPGGPIPASGLVIAAGMQAAAAAAGSSAPSVLNVMITEASQEKLLRDFPRRAGSQTFSTLYLDQPVKRQVRLIASMLPGKRSIGLLYSTPQKKIERMRREMNDHGLTLHELAVGPAHPLPDALQNILDSSEVLLALPDAAVYNNSTIRNILLAAYRRGVPLIGFSPGYVKAGALGAVYSTPGQIAAQAAGLIQQFGKTHVLPSAQYPHEFEVGVNEQVARSLGLQVKGASALHDEINSVAEEAP